MSGGGTDPREQDWLEWLREKNGPRILTLHGPGIVVADINDLAARFSVVVS
jgi:hypothetical protein